MFFPLRDYLPKNGFPIITAGLILANVLLYLVASGDPLAANDTAVRWGVIPYELTHGGMQCVPAADGIQMICRSTASIQAEFPELSFPPTWVTVIASMFLHGGLGHLVGNMMFLFVFGGALEMALGRFNFSMFYFFGGIFAVVAQVLWDTASPYPMVGASGAIAAVLAGYLVLFPSSKILALFIIFPVKVRAVWVLGSWIVFQLLDAWFIAGSGLDGGVAVFAHLGGFAVGIGLTYLLVKPEEIADFRRNARVVNGLFVDAMPIPPPPPSPYLNQPMVAGQSPQYVPQGYAPPYPQQAYPPPPVPPVGYPPPDPWAQPANHAAAQHQPSPYQPAPTAYAQPAPNQQAAPYPPPQHPQQYPPPGYPPQQSV